MYNCKEKDFKLNPWIIIPTKISFSKSRITIHKIDPNANSIHSFFLKIKENKQISSIFVKITPPIT